MFTCLRLKLSRFTWFVVGFVAAALFIVPYVVLGHGVYIQMTDQLDGEVLNYIYRAKYLFSGNGVIPELMNGVSAEAMTPPAPVGVLFYRLLSPFKAFACMHAFVILTGYIGMYLLSKELSDSAFISFVTAVLFVALPFYPVYGLSVLGQPLLVWALLRIYKTEGKKLSYFFLVVLYGMSSSLALSGFACLTVIGIACVCLALYRRRLGLRLRGVLPLAAAFVLLLLCYIICNLGLVRDMLGIGGGFVAHREEMIIAALGFADNFKTIFFEGGSYAKSYNMPIFVLAVFVILVKYLTKLTAGMRGNGGEEKTYTQGVWRIAALLLAALVISVLAALWRVETVVSIRMKAGGTLKSFQADRIYWLLPVCWYAVLALSLREMENLIKNMVSVLKTKFSLIMAAGACSTVTVSLVLIAGLSYMIYENSTIYHNLRLMIFPDTYHLMDWDDFYAQDVFEQIDEFIGEDKSTYRTVSLGITPAAALYNGFYCLDGYSNYYPLEYKHEFREIIADELSKSEELRVYFDSWGNRCYLFNGETGNFMMIPGVNGGSFEHLDLNAAKLYDMGGRYIFSALPIDNAEDMNLILMRDEPFETETSYYSIWLYKVQDF